MNSLARPAMGSSLPLARLLGHAADAVQAVRAGQSLTDVLARCPAEARPGTQALSFAVLRRLGSALAARALLAPKVPAPPVDNLLLTALALMWPGDPQPYTEHTLVDQAVTAARRRSAASVSFVNAVLRRFLREREAIAQAVQNDPVAVHNHPLWWIDRLREDWPDDWMAVLQAGNQRPPMTLRVNARRTTAHAYVQRLALEAGLQATVVGPQAVQLAAACPVSSLPGFAQGVVSVQDAAAQRAAQLLIGDGLPPGARVLDACAAPGGKTAHLLELADLDVLALDSDAERLARVNETLARLSLRAQTLAADAGSIEDWWDGRPFDAILLDAPCSASGIVRRHPDVRWLRRASDIPALAATQARLLDALWTTLRPGGRLLYCTCSVFKAEGQAPVAAFLQRHADAHLHTSPPTCPSDSSLGHLLPQPGQDGLDEPDDRNAYCVSADGFFYALIHKR